jgi:C4-dicarboxylate-specific signal transduction histidine kinase
LRDHMIELASSVAHEINQPLAGMSLAIRRRRVPFLPGGRRRR